MTKNEKQKKLCETILKGREYKIPKNDEEATTICMYSSITGVCLDYLGYLNEFPTALSYIRGRGGILKVEKDRILTLRDTLENMNDDPIDDVSQLPPYDPRVNGSVDAINIFLDNYITPCATLAFAFGGSITIRWDMVDIRSYYESGINAYTIIFDNRTKRKSFKDFLKNPM